MPDKIHTNLFDKYGGVTTVRRIVKDFYERVVAKPTLRRYFDSFDATRLVQHQAELVAYAMGKPAPDFSPQRLKDTHHGHGITLSAYEEVINILRQVLLDANVEGRDIAAIIHRMDLQRHGVVKNAPPLPNAYDPEHIDPLTGLGDRGSLDAVLAAECAKFDATGRALSLALIRPAPSVDSAMPADVHGWQLLERHLAGQLARTVRDADHVCRIGERLFALVLRATEAKLAKQAAERIRKAVQRDIFVSPTGGLHIDLVIGLASASAGIAQPAPLVAAAERALEQAVSSGSGIVAA